MLLTRRKMTSQRHLCPPWLEFLVWTTLLTAGMDGDSPNTLFTQLIFHCLRCVLVYITSTSIYSQIFKMSSKIIKYLNGQ